LQVDLYQHLCTALNTAMEDIHERFEEMRSDIEEVRSDMEHKR
jgi:hypothetical protein